MSLLNNLIQLFKGKTLYRTLTNEYAKSIFLKGNGIDLGAKSTQSTYYKYLTKDPNTQIVFSDYYSKDPQVLKIDLESHIPIEKESQDFLLLMNVLEHLYNYEMCIKECQRILKKGGTLYGVVPFIHKYHADPEDYFRYTHTTLRKIFSDVGFSKIDITPLGFGPFTAALSQVLPVISNFKIFAPILFVPCFILDKTIDFYTKSKNSTLKTQDFALGYFFVVEK